jgi:hypothetical protein
MANRQARRAARQAAARFTPRASAQPMRKLHPGVLSRTRDFQQWLAFVARVYGGAVQ